MRDSGRERGSALLLFPAGVLVVLLLGAIAFDLSLVYLRQRQAASVAADVANDLATLAFDEESFRGGGEFRLDPERAAVLGRELVLASDVAAWVTAIDVEVTAGDTITVGVAVEVDYLFAAALPGDVDGTVVRAEATAVAVSP